MAAIHADVVSPELVLVDPTLSVRERTRLAEPDTLARLRRSSSTSREPQSEPGSRPDVLSDGEDTVVAALRRITQSQLEPHLSQPARPSRLLLALIGAMAALCAIGAAIVDAPVERVEASLRTSAVQVPPAPEAGGDPQRRSRVAGVRSPGIGASAEAPKRVSPSKTRARGAVERVVGDRSLSARVYHPSASLSLFPRLRLAWPAVAEADGYRVELFRDGSRIFVTDTKRNRVVVPATWELGRWEYRVEQGDRLYVWPVVRGERTSEAIVDGELAVASRNDPQGARARPRVPSSRAASPEVPASPARIGRDRGT